MWLAFTGVGCGAPTTTPTSEPAAVPAPDKQGSVLSGCEVMDVGPFQEAFIRRYMCGEQIASAMVGPGPQSHAGHMQMFLDQAGTHGYEVQADMGQAEVGGEMIPVGFIFHRRPEQEGLAFTMLVITIELGDDAFLVECTVRPPADEADAQKGVALCTGAATELLDMARAGTFREL
jgi:hypothetical protein